MWFKGLAEPVRARAEIGDGSLQLKTDLPFLELDSTVGVAITEGGALLHGHIRSVAFAPGDGRRVPQLCIDVALTEASPLGQPELPRNARAQVTAAPAASTSLAPAAVHATAATDSAARVPSVVAGARGAAGGRRILGWLLALVVGAACGAGVALVWLAPRLQTLEGRGDDSAARTGARTDGHERPAVVATGPAHEAYAPAPSPALPVDPAIAEEGADEPPPAVVSLERYDLLAPRSAVDDDGVLAVAEGAWTAAVAHAQAAAAATQLPQVTVQGAQTHVFVPMEGDGQGLRQYELTTPGIAVTVPRARALIPHDNYNIQRGIVRRVWLRREGGGVQVRIITRRTATRAAASFDETGLSIVLEP